MQDGLLVVDPDGTFIMLNPAAEKLTGYKADELIGKSCRVLKCSGCEININRAKSGDKFYRLFSKKK